MSFEGKLSLIHSSSVKMNIRKIIDSEIKERLIYFFLLLNLPEYTEFIFRDRAFYG